MPFLSSEQLASYHFKQLGSNVMISEKASIYGASRISIGNNVRIDDFCILSAGEEGIELGSFIHIAAYVSLIGKALIKMEDFTGISSRTAVYSSSDDYTGKFLTNPTVPEEFTNVKHGAVILRKHVIVGAGSVILPGVEIGAGSAVGALSLVSKNVEPGIIVSGNPAKLLMKRSAKIFELEKELMEKIQDL